MTKIKLLLLAVIVGQSCFAQNKLLNKASYILNGESVIGKEIKVNTIPFSNCYCVSDDYSSKKIREVKGVILLISVLSPEGGELLLNIYTNDLQEGTYELLPNVQPTNFNNISNLCPRREAFKIPFVSFKKWQLKNPLVLASITTTYSQSNSAIVFKKGTITITKLNSLKRTINAVYNFETTHPDGGPLIVSNGALEINY